MTWDTTSLREYGARVRGCLLGGAVGDALGAPVEFMSLSQIQALCGEGGVREYLGVDDGGVTRYGLVTDDTQMTLFTAEGLIRAGVRTDRGIGFSVAVVHHAYDRWLDTQTRTGPSDERDGWLQRQQWLYARRAPGDTCLSALSTARRGSSRMQQFGIAAQNDSKGCGAVMRSAPFGLVPGGPGGMRSVFDWAAEAAGYTHGHVTGRLAAGTLAVIVSRLLAGDELPAAVDEALAELAGHPQHEETTAALRQAWAAALDRPATPQTVEALGAGWVAEEALAIGVYAALARPAPEDILGALTLAVTHSGDSDSTGAICGNILGAMHGDTVLPPELAFEVEGRGTILELADDFVYEFTSARRLHGDHGPHTRWTKRYPGW
jgi:ADP-ribosylglycohydrolase